MILYDLITFKTVHTWDGFGSNVKLITILSFNSMIACKPKSNTIRLLSMDDYNEYKDLDLYTRTIKRLKFD